MNAAIKMDNPVSEPIDRGPAWLPEVSDAKPPKHETTLLVTWAGQTPTPAIQICENGPSIRLHFLIVDYMIGIGFVVAGWFADPFAEVASTSVNVAVDEEVDFFSEVILLTDRHQMHELDVPRGVPVKFGFVLLVPERPHRKADRLHLRLHLVTGDKCDRVVPQVGDISDLSNILADLPVDFALQIVARLFNAWYSKDNLSKRFPERLEALAGQVHQWIDPRRDYGTQRMRARANCHVDVAIRVGTKGMMVAGWLIPDYADSIKEIAIVSLFGRRVIVDTPLPGKSRPDVLASEIGELARIDCGFAVFVAIERLDRLDELWFLEFITVGGEINRVPFVCPPEPLPLQGIEAAVALAEIRDVNLPDLFERAISPAVEWFWAQTRRPGLVSNEKAYGSLPPDPRVSVIVPVFGRIDFVRHQIAQFSNDPEFCADIGMVDLVYVLDDPTKTVEFNRLCQFLYDVYGIPFRTLTQSMNLGYSAANNAGAAIARGSLLLLLNSDVFPKQPRWVGHLARTYDTLDHCGILGCRLLFEDGSIQHAGMTFLASRMMLGCWENDHPGKGLSVAFDSHSSAASVPAVTGACLMIGRAHFDRLGGMSEEYVIADFEDSDLCLRAQEQGLKVYYTPEVELYHLERQSMRLIGHGNVWARQSLTLYNMWKQSRRWGTVIPEILNGMTQPSASEDTGHQPNRWNEAAEVGLGALVGFDQTETVKQRSSAAPVRSVKNRKQAITGKRPNRERG